MKLLKPRSLAFAFSSFGNVSKGSPALYQEFESEIVNKLNDFHPHYITKILSSLKGRASLK